MTNDELDQDPINPNGEFTLGTVSVTISDETGRELGYAGRRVGLDGVVVVDGQSVKEIAAEVLDAAIEVIRTHRIG